MGFESIGELDDSITSEQAAEWVLVIEESVAVIEGVVSKLEAHQQRKAHS